MTTIIDDTDIANYGMILSGDTMRSVLQWPAMKNPVTVDYPDEDGTRADLSSPALATRNMTLTFADMGGDADAFMAFLQSATEHVLMIDVVEGSPFWTMTFRMLDNPSYHIVDGKGIVTVSVSDYAPFLSEYVEDDPRMEAVSRDFYLDYMDLASYGVEPMDGCLDQIRRAHPVKDPLTWSSDRTSGAAVDTAATPKLKNKDITLSLWGCWNRSEVGAYKALLRDLTLPGYRHLEADGMTMTCWYKSSSIQALFYREGHVNMLFNIVLTVKNTEIAT